MIADLKAQKLALSCAMVSSLFLCGCATVAPNAPATTSTLTGYSKGRAIEEFPRDGKIVSAAAAEALDDLKMTAVKRSRDGTAYKIEAKTDDNRQVLLVVRSQKEISRVSCRVGWFGDEPLSKAILERVGIRLELLPPAPIPEKAPSSPAPNPFLLRDQHLKDGMIRDMIDAPYRDRVGP